MSTRADDETVEDIGPARGTESAHGGIDVNLGRRFGIKLGERRCRRKGGIVLGPGGENHRPLAGNDDAATPLVGERHPPSIGVGPVFLGHDIRVELLVDGRSPTRHDAARLTVGIRLERAGSEPGELVEITRDLEPHPHRARSCHSAGTTICSAKVATPSTRVIFVRWLASAPAPTRRRFRVIVSMPSRVRRVIESTSDVEPIEPPSKPIDAHPLTSLIQP